MSFDPSTSLFAGMDPTVLQAQLTATQQCLLQLRSGQKVASASYGQGDNSRTVSFSQAQQADCIRQIRELQAQLGIIAHPRRRALGVRF